MKKNKKTNKSPKNFEERLYRDKYFFMKIWDHGRNLDSFSKSEIVKEYKKVVINHHKKNSSKKNLDRYSKIIVSDKTIYRKINRLIKEGFLRKTIGKRYMLSKTAASDINTPAFFIKIKDFSDFYYNVLNEKEIIHYYERKPLGKKNKTMPMNFPMELEILSRKIKAAIDIFKRKTGLSPKVVSYTDFERSDLMSYIIQKLHFEVYKLSIEKVGLSSPTDFQKKLNDHATKILKIALIEKLKTSLKPYKEYQQSLHKSHKFIQKMIREISNAYNNTFIEIQKVYNQEIYLLKEIFYNNIKIDCIEKNIESITTKKSKDKIKILDFYQLANEYIRISDGLLNELIKNEAANMYDKMQINTFNKNVRIK